MYIWEHKEWPKFQRRDDAILQPLASARLKQGRLLGVMSRLGFQVKLQAQLSAMTEDVVKSSEIENEILNRSDVRSSVAQRIGAPFDNQAGRNAKVDGIVEVVLDATRNFDRNLTAGRLFGWHAAMFPTGYSGLHRIRVGQWRTDENGPMQIVSGPEGKRRVHFEAPPSARVEGEMSRFLEWFNSRAEPEALLRAAIAHLWFVTIHPFDDGNGRIARAITEMVLAQSEDSPQRFYTMAGQINAERKIYYAALERTQKGNLDLTPWTTWFLDCLGRAIDASDSIQKNVLRKADFWSAHAEHHFTERQKKILSRWLEGIEGNMTARKWAAFGKCSMPTAQRDVADLIERDIIRKNPGGGKNTSYAIVD